MHPVLVSIAGFPIHSYGFLIATGFLLCVWVSKREAERLGMPGEKLVDIGFWSLLIGLIGCRILYIVTRYSYYLEHPAEMFYVWEGGLVFFAGPLLNIPFFFWYTKRHNLDRWEVLDIGATAVPLAHAFGRLGCFSAGCCYGTPTKLPWGIRLESELVEPALRYIPIHPVQLYESAALFLLYFYLRRLRLKKSFSGQLAFTYLISYSIIRSITEIFRGDTIRGFIIDPYVSTSQFISLLVIIGTVIAYWRRRRVRCS